MKSELNIGRKDREMGCLPLLKSSRDFFSQAYDREKGELWGRTAVSWGKSSLWYVPPIDLVCSAIWCGMFCPLLCPLLDRPNRMTRLWRVVHFGLGCSVLLFWMFRPLVWDAPPFDLVYSALWYVLTFGLVCATLNLNGPTA